MAASPPPPSHHAMPVPFRFGRSSTRRAQNFQATMERSGNANPLVWASFTFDPSGSPPAISSACDPTGSTPSAGDAAIAILSSSTAASATVIASHFLMDPIVNSV
ncbi:hypothetical protein OPV22_022438 [Ensete ventricosum]|uniref:Uncharacterized protein n=1 Tax=Ensete ventricosum TaxID=4639 RepID=A0AAV8PE49_ENSVE|nr:hypothetical protein OPV22_022438 [Ensete ventricosum]